MRSRKNRKMHKKMTGMRPDRPSSSCSKSILQADGIMAKDRSAAGDFDGDGNLDLVNTNFIEDTPNLYRNNCDGSFEEYAQTGGLSNTKYMGWGVGFFDYDNDGWPDIFMVNGHVHPEIERLIPGW